MKQFNPIGIPSGSYGAGNKTMKKGFTLMEAIVAIFVITVGIVGTYALITMTISSATISKDKLIAAYLAQEGIEIVRNIRDGNWLEQRRSAVVPPQPPWDYGISEGDYETDYEDLQGFSYTCSSTPFTCGYDDLDFLEISGGFYGYAVGDETKFKRRITISNKEDLDGDTLDDKMTVTVEVSWQEKGTPQSITAQENLYNWRGQ